MKKLVLSIALVLALGLGASAQRDSFFSDWEDVGNGLDRIEDILPGLPNNHGLTDDIEAPLGSGLLILTALGAGYAVAKKRREE